MTCGRVSPLGRQTVKSEKHQGSLLWTGLWDRDPHSPTEKQNVKLSLSQLCNLNLFCPYGEGTLSLDINIKTGAWPQWKTPSVPGSSKSKSALQGCFFSSGHLNFVLKVHSKKDKPTQDTQ